MIMPPNYTSELLSHRPFQSVMGVLALSAVLLLPLHLNAQQPTTAAPSGIGKALIDHREEMRSFIQRIADYVRAQKLGFAIVARDAGELIIKRDVLDEKIISPARTFIRSIDGVMFDGVFAGHQMIGKAPTAETQTAILERIGRAKQSGLNVLSMEYATATQTINNVYKFAMDKGIVSSVAHRATPDLTEIPPYPKRPNAENSNNILALKDVKNFIYLSDPAAFGRQDQFALEIHDNNFDMVIVDPFSGRAPLTKTAVETLKYKKLGARRLVFARMDIATAASYRYYWQPTWAEGNPKWIAAPYPGDPDRYFVEYWNLGWQDVIFGNPQSFLFGLIAQGYDGVLIEGMRNYLVFEGNIEINKEFAPFGNPAK
jgi:cysteinyl-tRNA synthetase